MEKIKFAAKKIWADNNTKKNDWVVFRKKFILDELKEKVTAKIAIDTKYYLYINEEIIVFDGGLNWGPFDNAGYYDVVDIAEHLKTGGNEIFLICWYWGNEGRNNIDSKSAGLVFEAEEIGVLSDDTFEVIRHPAYYNTVGEQPAFLYGGHNIGYDARKEVADEELNFKASTIYEIQNDYYKRPIPQMKYSEILCYSDLLYSDGKLIAVLPFAAQITPCFELKASGGEIIDIRTDRYSINGGPGDDANLYNAHRVEYICKSGVNRFEALNWMFGEQVIYTIPEGVEIIKLGYRESGYQTEFVGDFKCSNKLVNRLVEKCKRTLYVCMRDNFMDCPDRERGQWIADVSVQVPQVFFVMDTNAVKLISKAIHDFIYLRKGNVLVGNVPGANYSELPSQSLNAISSLGMIAQYCKYSGDDSVLIQCFEPIIEYLKLWDIKDDGMVVKRTGDWYWFDHLYNVDEKILENTWYYLALDFAEYIGEKVNCHEHDEFIQKRKSGILENFDSCFWKREFYSSDCFADDRANALAVLSGLAGKDKYEAIRKVLVSVYNSTPYMEGYVIEALIKMGYLEDAYKRMMSRYYNLIENENSTLWEDFHILGTKNHAWSGSPLTILFKHFFGIDTQDGFKDVTITPNLSVLSDFECETMLVEGNLKLAAYKYPEKTSIKIINNSSSNITLILYAKKLGLNRISKINGEVIDNQENSEFMIYKGECHFIIE
jgi:alpha-L-rhamnosidase